MTPETLLDEIAERVVDVLQEDRQPTAQGKLTQLAFTFCSMLDGCGQFCFRVHGSDDGKTYSGNLTGTLHERIHERIRALLAGETGGGK